MLILIPDWLPTKSRREVGEITETTTGAEPGGVWSLYWPGGWVGK